MLKHFSLLLFILPIINYGISFEISFITDIQYLITLADEITNIASDDVPFERFFDDETKSPAVELSQNIDQIYYQALDTSSNEVEDLAMVFTQTIRSIEMDERTLYNMEEFQKLLNKFGETEIEYRFLTGNLSTYNQYEIEKFATFITSIKAKNFREYHEKVYSSVISTSTLVKKGLYSDIMREIDLNAPGRQSCDLDISYQHRMFKIYSLIIITELRALLMFSFSYKMLSGYNNETYKGEISKDHGKFVMKSEQYLLEIQQVMRQMSPDIHRCEAEFNQLDETYLELEGTFTAVIVHQFSIEGGCKLGCGQLPEYNRTQCIYKKIDYYFSSETVSYCQRHPCNGRAYDCQWIGGAIDMCETSLDSLRRYEYIRSYSNERFYGDWIPCGDGSIFKQVKNFEHDSYNCGICLCDCAEEEGVSPAIRTFSLRPQISNIDENKVVSDVRFVLKDNMIHVQIEESPLLIGGQLNKSHSAWAPLEDFKYSSSSTPSGGFFKVDGDEEISLTKDIDFAFITKYQRYLDIDEISAGPNYVVTGVRLSRDMSSEPALATDENPNPIQLQIHVTPFDFLTGKLDPSDKNSSQWLSASNQPNPSKDYDNQRVEVKINKYIRKFDETPFTPVDLKTNRYIRFDQSSVHSDAGQTTIPFLDARPVAMNNNLALGGIGIVYRGDDEYAGIVAFKVSTINFLQFIKPAMTNNQKSYYSQHLYQSLRHPIPTSD